MTETFYTQEIGSNGNFLMLYRFTETETEFKSEYFDGSEWIQDYYLIEILRDSHSSEYEEIDTKEAGKITEQLGGSIYND